MSKQHPMTFDDDYTRRHYECPVCKKIFYIPMTVNLKDWAYKLPRVQRKNDKGVLETIPAARCCSYTCHRKGLKERE